MKTAAIKTTPLRSVGYLSDVDIRRLLQTFPPGAQVSVSDTTIAVANTQGYQMLSAAKLPRATWYVRAVPGLVTASYPQHLS